MLLALFTHELHDGYGVAIVICAKCDTFGADRWFATFLVVAHRFQSVKHLDFFDILCSEIGLT